MKDHKAKEYNNEKTNELLKLFKDLDGFFEEDNCIERVEKLIQTGADVNVVDNSRGGQTLLDYIICDCQDDNSIKIAEILLKNGADFKHQFIPKGHVYKIAIEFSINLRGNVYWNGPHAQKLMELLLIHGLDADYVPLLLWTRPEINVPANIIELALEKGANFDKLIKYSGLAKRFMKNYLENPKILLLIIFQNPKWLEHIDTTGIDKPICKLVRFLQQNEPQKKETLTKIEQISQEEFCRSSTFRALFSKLPPDEKEKIKTWVLSSKVAKQKSPVPIQSIFFAKSTKAFEKLFSMLPLLSNNKVEAIIEKVLDEQELKYKFK